MGKKSIEPLLLFMALMVGSTIVFISLKMSGLIPWSWWAVFSPALLLFIVIVVLVLKVL